KPKPFCVLKNLIVPVCLPCATLTFLIFVVFSGIFSLRSVKLKQIPYLTCTHYGKKHTLPRKKNQLEAKIFMSGFGKETRRDPIQFLFPYLALPQSGAISLKKREIAAKENLNIRLRDGILY